MPHQVLITGSASLLASHLAALRLVSTRDTVFLLLRRPDGTSFPEEDVHALVCHATRRLLSGPEAEARWEALCSSLIQPPGLLETLQGATRLDEVWYVGGGVPAAREVGEQAMDPELWHLLKLLPRLGATELNVVGLAPGAALERDVETACAASGVGHRLFHTCLLVGEPPAVRGADREGFLALLAALHDLKGELEERHPGYFGSRPLRCWAPSGTRLELLRVEEAAAQLLRLARSRDTLSRRSFLTAPERIPFTRLCENVGRAYGLHLLTVEDLQALNAVDRSLHERLGGFHAALSATREPPPGEGAGSDTRPPGRPPLDDAAQVALFEAIRHGQDAVRAGQRAHAAALLDSLEQRTLERKGAPLTYRVGGSGDIPVVLLNALGQDLFYWQRLISCLLRGHRVLIWKPRGTDSGPRPFLLQDQVDDLEAILQHEGIDRCHLVGWCTGPKVAVEFYLRRPAAVASMVFLNGSFRCVDSSKEHETAYERSFGPLCHLLVHRPEMAASVRKSLQLGMSQEEDDLSGLPDAEAASRVLALMNRDLKPHVLAPFRSEPLLTHYARQIVDFWSYDVREKAEQVRVPVLLISAEHDAVASPETSRDIAARLPDARHVHVRGATHYCLYDRPEFIAEQMDEFFRRESKTRSGH